MQQVYKKNYIQELLNCGVILPSLPKPLLLFGSTDLPVCLSWLPLLLLLLLCTAHLEQEIISVMLTA